MQHLADKRGGKCLSEKCVNASTKLKWQCKEGHEWDATPNKIKQGQWCPYCARCVKLSIKEMQSMAKSRGGLCLSTNYANAHTKLIWQCKEGHIWKATANGIQQGQWCPKCSEGISERICRKIFENIFDEKFPKRRPEWLVTPQGIRMELDGYCKKLKIAFEYQGVQHYGYHPRFHVKRTFDQQKSQNYLKRKKCEDNYVVLIEVPHTVDYEKMPEYIIRECKKRNIEIPEITKSLDYKLMNVYSPEKLKEMQEIAKEKGGLCLSKKYINSMTKLRLQCAEGHIWEAAPGSIKSGHWCPKCCGHAKLTIEEMRNLAEQKGGFCLSEKYINSKTKLKWQCEKGHIWETTADCIKQGQWCPYCSHHVRLSIDEMKKIAENRGGICLSDVYISANTKLRWQCKEGHIWKATPGNIKSGQWCPKCGIKKRADKRRLTIEEMQKTAEEREGKCLSEKYLNNNTKLEWQCKEGHIWETRPSDIRQGKWCPICGAKRTAEAVAKLRLTIEEMQELAKSRGGICLSTEYINNNTNLKWKCKEGHTWEATPSNIKRSTWCPVCGAKKAAYSRRLGIEEMREIAKTKDGKCLSDIYINDRAKLKWQCKEGHIWQACADKVKQGRWCPYCAHRVRLSIEEMHKIAEQRGGKCISENYVNNNTKLKWQCREGHEWEAAPHNIKSGTWCPICARHRKRKT
jgi:hypothetical protein